MGSIFLQRISKQNKWNKSWINKVCIEKNSMRVSYSIEDVFCRAALWGNKCILKEANERLTEYKIMSVLCHYKLKKASQSPCLSLLHTNLLCLKCITAGDVNSHGLEQHKPHSGETSVSVSYHKMLHDSRGNACLFKQDLSIIGQSVWAVNMTCLLPGLRIYFSEF